MTHLFLKKSIYKQRYRPKIPKYRTCLKSSFKIWTKILFSIEMSNRFSKSETEIVLKFCYTGYKNY